MNVICNVGGPRIANDRHYYLIKMWEELLKGWVPEKITRDEYYKVRNSKESYPDYYVGWVGFNCSYSGKWFGGFAGDTATKIGTIRDYQKEAIRNVLGQVKGLDGVVLKNLSYLDLEIPSGSVVYCDPPYEGTTKYAGDFDHKIFWDWVRETSAKHTVFVSEYKAPEDFICVWQKEAKSSLSANGKGGGNKNSIERLFRLG